MNNSEGLKPFQQSLAGLPQWVSERILQQINQLTRYEPVIGIMGKTGVGKSSLCNALFAGDISPVSDVAACTREPLRFRLQVGDRYMTLVDLPGVGESGARDTEYAAMYREQLPRLDLVLWLIKADDRALAVDEHFYHQVIGEVYRHKVLFVISQSDKAEPTSGGGPLSTAQKQNISRKICLLHELFQPVHPVAALEREEFRVLYLDNQNQLIAHETLFTGTINRTEVHPREVVKRALHFNAAAVILAHNHPSGETTPSQADKTLTQRLVQVLQLVDIRVPDHLIVGGRQIYSFAEHGLL